MGNYRQQENEQTTVRFPSIKAVAACLVGLKDLFDGMFEKELDVRLRVQEDGDWDVIYGDPSYDLDHRGYWGYGYLVPRSNCRDLAKELIAEAEDDYHSSR